MFETYVNISFSSFWNRVSVGITNCAASHRNLNIQKRPLSPFLKKKLWTR